MSASSARRPTPAPPIVVMGVSGSGKSTIAEAIAAQIDGEDLDADDFHPEANVRKMSSGVPLTDTDRWPWLDTLGTVLRQRTQAGTQPVLACSALRRAYRDRLRGEAPTVYIVCLAVSRQELERRLLARTSHFMPASLLLSQLATLEPLADDEPGITIGADGDPAAVAAQAIAAIHRR